MEGTSLRYEFEDGSFVEVAIARIPRSERWPSGVKYRFQFVDSDGVPSLRFDNAHGRHERHVGPDADGEAIDYEGMFGTICAVSSPRWTAFVRTEPFEIGQLLVQPGSSSTHHPAREATVR